MYAGTTTSDGNSTAPNRNTTAANRNTSAAMNRCATAAMNRCTTTMDAAACAGSAASATAAPHLDNLILISCKMTDQIFWKNRNRRTHRRQSKKYRTRKSRDGQLGIEFHGILRSLPSFTGRFFPAACRIVHLSDLDPRRGLRPGYDAALPHLSVHEMPGRRFWSAV
jgi:hypothetical protein